MTFHKANGDGTVVAPLCTVKGYTRFTCSACGESYRTTYVAALGHNFCKDLDGSDNSCDLTPPSCTQTGRIVRTCRRDGCSETKEEIVPAKGHTPKPGTEKVFIGYKTYECDVCGVPYTLWDDDRLSHVSYPEQTVVSIGASDNGSYPWVYNAELDRFESSNQDQNNTSSTTSFTFTLSAPTALRFGYGVSSENNCDELTITLAADGSSAETLVNAVSGENSGSINKQLAAGSYTLTFSYEKDPGARSGSDTAYVSVLTLSGMTRVIVENTTFPKAEGAAWEGTLADTWIELTDEATMMSCIVNALEGYTVEGAEDGYITSINGLAAFNGGTTSGWMGTLNDWFTNKGFANFTVAADTLHAGDEIRIMYTRTASDLGGSWDSTDTRLKALTFSAGKLAPKFSGDTFTFTLTVPEGTTRLLVTPTAANKNYQVRTYLGTQAAGREYSRISLIPIENGSVITVVCADDSWPTMNVTDDGELKSDGKRTYTINVAYGEVKAVDAGVTSVKVAGVEAAAGADNTYTVTVPHGTTVTADSFVIVTSDFNATVGALTNEGNVWSFTVTAEDGVTTKTYTVTVSFTEPPKSNDAGVSSITVAGVKAKAGTGSSYIVTVPYGTDVKASSFVIVTNHPRATVGGLTESGNVWSFTVTAEDGVATAVYTVKVTIAALPEPFAPAVDNKKPASKPEAKLPFADVSTSDWFYDDVMFVYENGLFSGTDSSSSFSPNASMTRAMLVTVLYRLEGEPAVTGGSSFSDVRSGSYYEKAVAWAAANGIVTGTGSTAFSPDAKVTREQLAAILYRYAQYKELATNADAKLNSFTDAGSVSGYASEALDWAVSEGLINGASGKLMPKGDATRVQVAAIFHRFVKNVVK